MITAQIQEEKIILQEMQHPKLENKKGAIVKVLGCGLCGSDIVKFKHKISPNGTVLGHEIVAEIIEINTNTRFRKGDKIVTSHHIPCGECNYCRHGNVSMCEHFKKTNIVPGGFSEYVFVSEEHLENVAYHIPNNISEEEISFYEPLACCLRAIRRSSLIKGDSVLVVGLGSIGILMGEALKALGYKVYGCDLISERITLANRFGIESFSSQNLEEFDKIIQDKTNAYGVDAVFMVSGADKAIDVALKTIRMGGKILVFSSTPKNLGYANNEIYYKELSVLGSYSPDLEDLKLSYDLLVSKKVCTKGLSTVYDIHEIQKAFDDTMQNKILKAYIKF